MTLIGGRPLSARLARLYQRMNALYGLPGVISDQSASRSTPSKLWTCFAPFVLACIAATRSAGSASCTGSDTNRFDTLFALSRCPALRVETGTPATKGFDGSSSRSAR